MLLRVLLAADRAALRTRLASLLSGAGAHVEAVRGGPGSWSRLARKGSDLVLVSRSRIPRPEEESIRLLRETPEEPEVVVLLDGEDEEARTRLLAAGCEAVIAASDPHLEDRLAAALERRRRLAAAQPPEALGAPRLSDFVSASPAMQAFLSVVERVTDSDASLLVLGETGVGKERLARAIHAAGRRSSGPFVTVNCGALPEGLLESELFGHEQGAFTGATRSRRGRFELAHGGTLFLDEIGETPLHLQVKLLRALQDREIQPIGGESPIPVDVRIMAATNRDLDLAVQEGSFRRDLFYRLGVVPLTLPALRDRREDIPDLADSFVLHYASVIGRDVERITPKAMEALAAYEWPGNVRELMNVVERAILLCDGPEISRQHLPECVARAVGPPETIPLPGSTDTGMPASWLHRTWADVRREVVAAAERAYLAGHLEASGGRIGDTAGVTGMDPRSLYEKMRRHGLRKEDYR